MASGSDKISMEGTANLRGGRFSPSGRIEVEFTLTCSCGATLEYKGPMDARELLVRWDNMHLACGKKTYTQPPLPWTAPQPYPPTKVFFWESESTAPESNLDFEYGGTAHLEET